MAVTQLCVCAPLCLDYNMFSLRAAGIRACVGRRGGLELICGRSSGPSTLAHMIGHAPSPAPPTRPGRVNTLKTDRHIFLVRSDLIPPPLSSSTLCVGCENMKPSVSRANIANPLLCPDTHSWRCCVSICCIPRMTSPPLRLLPHSHRVE